mmetsp:Transcript_25592/g.46579  ORF Transcript_25592/g.46579 Transcript_25592/m.46579 type:complete len:82 (-) Transcript_25592:639-884(-)
MGSLTGGLMATEPTCSLKAQLLKVAVMCPMRLKSGQLLQFLQEGRLFFPEVNVEGFSEHELKLPVVVNFFNLRRLYLIRRA